MRKILLLAFSPSAVILLFDVFFYYRPIAENGCFGICDGPIYLMLITDCGAFICLFYAASKLFINRNVSGGFNVKKCQRTLAAIWYLLSLFSVIVLYGFLIYQVFGVINPLLVFENYDHFYSMSGTGTAWVFLLFNFFCFLLIYDVYMGAGGVFKISVCIITLLTIAATGGRSIIVVLILFILFVHVVINKKIVTRTVVGCGIVLILSVFFGNALLRSGGADAYRDEATKFDFDNAFILNDVIDYVDINGPKYLVSGEDFYYFFCASSSG